MLNAKKFQRKKEDFTCLNCGQKVLGNGYTNHCHNCLWSRHVDINPGDRRSDCLGAMFPKEISQKNCEYIIKHHCLKCGHKKNNKISSQDNFEAILNITNLQKSAVLKK